MQNSTTDFAEPAFSAAIEGECISLHGALDIHAPNEARNELDGAVKRGRAQKIDLGDLAALDSSGALLLCALQSKGAALVNAKPEHQSLIDEICALEVKPLPKPGAQSRWRCLLIQLGMAFDRACRDSYAVTAFIGHAAEALVRAPLRPHGFNPPSISRQIAETGIDALPIVGLMAVMISIVIGYQGVAQLRPYGSEEFTINLIAVSVLREMGVLITAIMIAGRTGSAFAAEIGVMRTREEIDALQVLGMEPMELLVLPRLVGLAITLPLLTVFADFMGLAGGAAISRIELQLSPLQYLDRVHTAVTMSDFVVGLVKAPVFAGIIAIVGCMHGLRANTSAESVGRETTAAVVKSIFLVIVLDALFSILFERMGV